MSCGRVVEDNTENLLTEKVSQAIGTKRTTRCLLGPGKGRKRRVVVALILTRVAVGIGRPRH